MKLKKCSNCNRRDWNKLFSISKFISLRKTYALYQCLNCSLLQLHPFPTRKELGRLYSYSDPDTHNRKMSILMRILYVIPGGKETIHRYVHVVHQQRQRLVLQYVLSGKLLDAGCGTGEFLSLFNQKKWQLTGIEVNRNLTANLKTKYPHIHISNSSIETYQTKSKFDIITLWHVFEHLRSPDKIINKLSYLLKSKCLLIIEVPQADSISRKLFNANWNLLMFPEHHYFWTSKSLTQLLAKNGFVIKRVIYRGFASSFLGSFVNWMRTFGIPSTLSTTVGICVYPLILLLYVLFPKTRDNLIIVTQKTL